MKIVCGGVILLALVAGGAVVDPETSPDYFRRTVGLKALPKDAVSHRAGLPDAERLRVHGI